MLGAGYLLYRDYTAVPPKVESLTPTKVGVGHVDSVEGEGHRQDEAQGTWGFVTVGAQIYAQDSLRTGGQASALAVRLNDGSRFVLTSNAGQGSLVTFEAPNTVDVKLGDVVFNELKPGAVIYDRLASVVSTGANSSVVRVLLEVDGQSEVQVLKGQVAITDRNKQFLRLTQGFAGYLNNGVISQSAKLAVFVKAPEPNDQIHSNLSAMNLAFTWDVNDPSIHDDRLQISKSDLFSDVTEVRGHGAASSSVNQGATVFWRVAWISKGVLNHTETRKITFEGDNRVELKTPENEKILELKPEENQVDFTWSTSLVNPKFFKLEVSTTPDFIKLLSSQTTKDLAVSLKGLQSQKYFWRVTAYGEKNETLSTSMTKSFTLNSKVPAVPELITPATDTSWSTETIEFVWKKLENATQYRLSFYKDLALTTPVDTKTVSVTRIKWKPKEDSGSTYYWVVRALNRNGTVIGQSETRDFTIKPNPIDKTPKVEVPLPLSPLSKQALTFSEPKPQALSWKEVQGASQYHIILKKMDEKPSPLVIMDTMQSETTLTSIALNEGSYSWTIAAVDSENHEGQRSAPFLFTVKILHANPSPTPAPTATAAPTPETSATPEPLPPKAMDAPKGRDVSFSWEAIPGAVSYEIQIADLEDFEKPLIENKVETLSLTASLKPKKYFFRVRGIDDKGVVGPWSPNSTLSVAPAIPELKLPEANFSSSFYDSNVLMTFTWNECEGCSLYEIVVKDAKGTDIIDATTEAPTYSTTAILDGSFTWKVRGVTPDEISSDFSEPRPFKLERSPFGPPQLLGPDDQGKNTTHRPMTFTWNKDSSARFSDLVIEQIDGDQKIERFPNLKETTFTKTFETPGQYKWYVSAKATKDSSEIKSAPRYFKEIYDPLHGGNFEIEINYSNVNDRYSTTSSLQTAGNTQINQQSISTGNFEGFTLGYYLTRGLGLYVSGRAGTMSLEKTTANEQESDATLRLRFGANKFAQEYWFGYRKMDIFELENTPAVSDVQFTTTGPLIGTRMIATVNSKVQIPLTFYYYKPLFTAQNLASFNGDVMGGSVGVKYNLTGYLWLGYHFGYENIVANYNFQNQPPNVNANWRINRIEPLFFSLSFEH
ncbi:unnamed protein product [Sphagnum balticum]